MSETINTSLNTDIPVGCGCSACQNSAPYSKDAGSDTDLTAALTLQNSYDAAYSDANDGGIQDDSGPLSPGPDALPWGVSWNNSGQASYGAYSNDGSGTTLTYKFFTSLPGFYSGSSENNNFQAFNSDMQQATLDIFDHIESIINIDFVSSDSDAAHLGFGTAYFADVNGNASKGAHGYYPHPLNGDKAGDVWLNNHTQTSYNMAPDPGDPGYQTIIHEIGHALGLKHTFSTSAYNTNTLSGVEDSLRYSTMSYTYQDVFGPGTFIFPETFQLYDIAALQAMYGANTSHNTGDDVYAIRGDTAYTIWDAGGIDTLDASAYATDSILRLGEGTFSSVDGYDRNIAIAYNVTIENAKGGSGNDTIYGNDAANILTGGLGDDALYGSAGNDTLYGGDGVDSITYSVNLADFILDLLSTAVFKLVDTTGTFGTDILYDIENYIFADGAYSHAEMVQHYMNAIEFQIDLDLNGSLYRDSVLDEETQTLNADDLGVSGGSGALISYSRAGHEFTLTVHDPGLDVRVLKIESLSAVTEIVVEGTHASFAVNYTGYGAAEDITISVAGNDRLDLKGGDDVAHTGDGDDTIYSGSGNDMIYAGNGHDTLYGDGGDDILFGDSGDDTAYGGDGNDLIQGGFGNDTIYGDLMQWNDSWSGDDRLFGNSGNDTIYGHGGNDEIDGGDGDDTIYGGHGDDTIYGGTGGDTILSDDASILYGNDTVYGGDGDDEIHTRGGNDTVYGGAGNDAMYGGDGVDTVDFSQDTGGVFVDLRVRTGVDGSGGADYISGFENVTGSAYDDILAGGNEDNVLRGGAGNDRLHGRGGNDVFIGGAGEDRIYGDGGHDIVDYSGESSGVKVNLRTTIATDGGGYKDTIKYVEEVIGSDYDDVISGGAQADILHGGAGDDTLSFTSDIKGVYVDLRLNTVTDSNGYTDAFYDFESVTGSAYNDTLIGNSGANTLRGDDGIDTVDYSHETAGIFVDLRAETATDGSGGVDTLYGIEIILGTDYADIIGGDNLANTLYGGAGNDRLHGRGGDDVFVGGLGSDTMYGDGGFDTLDYSAATNGVTVNLRAGTATDGSGGTDAVYQMEGVIGSAYNDTITGNAGASALDGGAGTDTLDYSHDTAGIFADLRAGTGTDDSGATDTLRGFENVVGSAYDDVIGGGNDNSVLEGGDGNDRLHGRDGDDVIRGGAGDDILYGDGGVDLLDYSQDGAGVFADLRAGTATDGSGGTDAVYQFENLTGSSHDDVLGGDNAANILTGGDGNDRLHGRDGDDTLNGGTGNDTLYGDGGSDIFALTSLSGVDTVKDFTLDGPDADSINVSDLLSGYDSESGNLNNFVRLVYQNSNNSELQVNTDGQGGDWQTVANIQADLSGVSVDSLNASAQLIADISVFS